MVLRQLVLVVTLATLAVACSRSNPTAPTPTAPPLGAEVPWRLMESRGFDFNETHTIGSATGAEIRPNPGVYAKYSLEFRVEYDPTDLQPIVVHLFEGRAVDSWRENCAGKPQCGGFLAPTSVANEHSPSVYVYEGMYNGQELAYFVRNFSGSPLKGKIKVSMRGPS